CEGGLHSEGCPHKGSRGSQIPDQHPQIPDRVLHPSKLCSVRQRAPESSSPAVTHSAEEPIRRGPLVGLPPSRRNSPLPTAPRPLTASVPHLILSVVLHLSANRSLLCLPHPWSHVRSAGFRLRLTPAHAPSAAHSSDRSISGGLLCGP